jgi:hypothetical protein
MTDHRTKRQKLEAMANQSVSPNEAEIARRKLGRSERVGRKTSPKWKFFIDGRDVTDDIVFIYYS